MRAIVCSARSSASVTVADWSATIVTPGWESGSYPDLLALTVYVSGWSEINE